MADEDYEWSEIFAKAKAEDDGGRVTLGELTRGPETVAEAFDSWVVPPGWRDAALAKLLSESCSMPPAIALFAAEFGRDAVIEKLRNMGLVTD